MIIYALGFTDTELQATAEHRQEREHTHLNDVSPALMLTL